MMGLITLLPNDYDTELSQKILEESLKQNKTTHEIQREIFYTIFDVPSHYSVKNRNRCVSRIFTTACKNEHISRVAVIRRYLREYFGMPPLVIRQKKEKVQKEKDSKIPIRTRILIILDAAAENMVMREISRASSCNYDYVRYTLYKMQDLGYVMRCATDRKSYKWSITDLGRRVVQTHNPDLTQTDFCTLVSPAVSH